MNYFEEILNYLKMVWTQLAPVFTQGTVAIQPLIAKYPWPALISAFLFFVLFITILRIAGSFIRLLIFPMLLIVLYVMFVSGENIFTTTIPLIENKLK